MTLTLNRPVTELNIRNQEDRAVLLQRGFRWARVCPRGDHKGDIQGAYVAYEAANRAARGRDQAIVDLKEDSY